MTPLQAAIMPTCQMAHRRAADADVRALNPGPEWSMVELLLLALVIILGLPYAIWRLGRTD